MIKHHGVVSLIENQLSAYSEIKQAIIQVQKSTQQNHKILVAYYIADKKIDEYNLLQHLKKQLPDYMLPNIIELNICQVYAEILDLDINHVSIYDDFFRLDGNSLLAIQTIHRLSKINKSELHLLISSDETFPKAIFNAWKPYFKKQSFLYTLKATHSTYLRQESAKNVKIINEILKEKP